MQIHELCAFINDQYGRLGHVTPRAIKRWRDTGAIPRPKGAHRWAYYTDEHVRAIKQILENRYQRRTLTDWAEARAYQAAEQG